MVGATAAQVCDGLEEDPQLGAQSCGAQTLGDGRDECLARDFGVDRAQDVRLFGGGQIQLAFGLRVGRLQEAQSVGRTQDILQRVEGDEFIERGHVDAVTVRIEDGRGAGGHDDFLRPEAVEDGQDGIAHRGPADNRIIEHHKRVPRPHEAIGDVVDVHGQILAGLLIGDEGTELRVLDGHLPEAHGAPLGGRGSQQRLKQAVETDLRGVGDIAQEEMLQIPAHGTDDLRRQGVAQPFALGVDVGVVGAGEVNPLEDAGATGRGIQAVLQRDRAVGRDEERLAGWQLAHILGGDIKGRLDGGPLRGHGHHRIVLIPIGGADAVGIAQGEGGPIPERAAEHEGAVEPRGGLAQDVGHPAETTRARPLLLQGVGQALQDDGAVGQARQVVARGGQPVGQFAGVGEVEVAREEQEAVEEGAVAHKGMAGAEVVSAEGGVA